MENRCESSINLVNLDKPKMLTGLTKRKVDRFVCSLITRRNCSSSGEETAPNLSGTSHGTW